MKNQKKRAGMKGVSLVIPTIVIIIILLMLLAAINIPLIKTSQYEKDLEVRSEIHTMSNALDTAKLYMETSLEYSIYQACYDNLRNGGWDSFPANKYQGYAVWDSSDLHPNDQEFKLALEESIASNLALYRGTQAYTFLSDYHVNLPVYQADNVTVNLNPSDPQWMFVVAWGDQNLNIQKTQESGEYIRLEKESTLQNEDEYRIDCYWIYRKGAEVYGTAAKAVKDALASVNPPRIIMVNQGETLQDKVLPYQKKFNDTVRSALYALSTTSADYNVDVYVYSADLKYVNDGLVTGAETPVRYIPEVYVKFEITNIKDNQQFPIYDGQKVVLSPMTLVFVGKFGGS